MNKFVHNFLFSFLLLLPMLAILPTLTNAQSASGGNGGGSGGLMSLPSDNSIINRSFGGRAPASWSAIEFREITSILTEGMQNTNTEKREAVTVALKRYFFFPKDFKNNSQKAEIARLWLDLYRNHYLRKGVPNESNCNHAFDTANVEKANLDCGFAFYGLEVASAYPLAKYLKISFGPSTSTGSAGSANKSPLLGATVNGKPWYEISGQQTLEILQILASYRRVRQPEDKERTLLLEMVFRRALGSALAGSSNKMSPLESSHRNELFNLWVYFNEHSTFRPGSDCYNGFVDRTDTKKAQSGCGFSLAGFSVE